MYLGDLIDGGTHDFKFSTFDQTGAGATLSGTPVISCYKDNSITQTTAGITLTVDFDSLTGLNHVRLVLTDSFYVADTDYDLVITTGTVDGISIVGRKIASFSISNRLPNVNLTQISGDSTAADNLEATYDGTGYSNLNAPATQSQVNNIGSASGGAFNFSADTDNTGGAIKSVTFVGSQTNTFTATESEDGTNHIIDHTGNAFDIVYQYDIGGGRTGVEVTFKGYLNGSNDSCNIQIYDFVGADWETIKTISGQTGSSNVTEVIPILNKHTGTGSDLGMVLVRIVTSGQSGSQLNIDQLLVAAVNTGQTVGYANGRIWIDTNNGTAGTESFVNGTADNPVNSIADAITISGNIGLTSFNVATGSSITLAATAANYLIEGQNWTLAFGGQSISGSQIVGATVSGVFTGTTGILEDCVINAITGPGLTMRRCFFNDVTMTNNGTSGWFMNDCRSRVAGDAAPNFDFGASAAGTNLNMRNYSGGIEIENMGQVGTDNASIEGFGQLITNVNCPGGNISLRGMWKVSNNGSCVITKDDVESSVDLILLDTVDIQSRLPASLVGGKMDSDATAISGSTAAADNLEESAKQIVQGACEGTPSTTSIQTDLAEIQDDIYIGRTVIFTSGNAKDEATDITDYVGSSGTLTVTALANAPSAADTFIII